MNKPLGAALFFSLAILLAACPQANPAASPAPPIKPLAGPEVVISQVYGGGGNSGAPFTNDFVELFNKGDAPATLTGYSVQYASATGTGNFSSNGVVALSGNLNPGQYYLVQLAGGANGSALPTPNATGTINMSGTAGKVVLVNTATGLACNGGSTACSSAQLASILDLVGYGNANFFEGGGSAPTLSNTTSGLRAAGGCTDTNNNAADFTSGAPTPRNTSSPLNVCGEPAPSVSSISPANNATSIALTANLVVTFSEPVNVTGAWLSLACPTSGNRSITDFAVSGGPTTFTLDPNAEFAANETCTVTITASLVTDQDAIDPPDAMTANFTSSFTTQGPPTYIREIQGAGHVSPRNTQTVSNVPGIVTAKRSNGFYLQDPNPDASDATSEAIFVFTSSAPTVNVGDALLVSGRVSEFRAGGAASTNLTITQIGNPGLSITTVSSGNPLPAPVVIGTGGRVPPNTVIDDDATGDVETSGTFDPTTDGIDFYESLESMLVQINNPVAVGPTNDFGEIPVVGDNGANASVRTTRGGIVIQSTDFNPERILLDDSILPTPSVNVSDRFSGPAVGVLDYSFANFKLQITQAITGVSGGIAPESTAPAGTNQLSIATFNVENLDPGDGAAKFGTLAGLIVNNLKSPDIVALEEVQDNNGPTNDGTVDATTTLNTLVSAITAAGGPSYQFRQINPVDGQDGGEPGGNIRVAFLYRTDRGLGFVDRPGGSSIAATSVLAGSTGPQLSFSPGRIDPTNTAFNTSRKPLAGEFVFNNHTVFVVANHFNSKGGDQPLFGHFQPPTRSSEVQRTQQAQVVRNFVASILALDANANVVVLGDLNDFEFSPALGILKSAPLNALIETLPLGERYTYNFEGNAQALDHILVSNGLFGSRPFAYDVVHVNSEFAVQASNHDPQVVRITLNDPPSADAGGPYTVAEGGSVLVNASGTDRENGPLSYAWDLDGNGSFETGGQSVTLSAVGLDGPGSRTITVRVTDNGGLSATATATVNVTNAPPSLTSVTNSGPIIEGSSAVITVSASDPAGVLDPLSYEFDCNNDGSYEIGPQGSSSASCAFGDNGGFTVGVRVSDGDGGAVTGSTIVTVNNAAPSVDAVMVSPSPSIKGASVTASAGFTDPGANDAPFTCTVNYGDGSGNLAGVVSGNTCTGPAHAYVNVGVYTVTLSVSDKDGGTGSRTATHRVVYAFAGFFAPISNPPAVNDANSGQAVPIKFSLAGNQGLNVLAPGSPTSQQVNCMTLAPIGSTQAATSNGFTYDAGADVYTFVWKTDKSWQNTCRVFTLTLADGTSRTALFRFTR